MRISTSEPTNLILTVGPTATRLFAAAPIAGSASRPRTARVAVTAEYPASETDLRAYSCVCNLATNDGKGNELPNSSILGWCRNQASTGDGELSRWVDPLPGRELVPEQVKLLYRYHLETGRWNEIWDDALPTELANVHVIAYLGDGASCLLPELLDAMSARLFGRAGQYLVHLHAVLPTFFGRHSRVRDFGACHAVETLIQLEQLAAHCKGSNWIWSFVGGSPHDVEQSFGEVLELVSRLTLHNAPDVVSRWCQDQLARGKVPGQLQPAIGTYRCSTTSTSDRGAMEAVRPWLPSFAEQTIPAHRRDLLGRLVVGWDTPAEWLAEAKRHDPRWDGVGQLVHSNAWTQCQFWLGLEFDDLWWWNPAARRTQRTARINQQVEVNAI